jgi:hypothetical protein
MFEGMTARDVGGVICDAGDKALDPFRNSTLARRVTAVERSGEQQRRRIQQRLCTEQQRCWHPEWRSRS